MSPAKDSKGKSGRAGAESDIYTSLLGLAFLALAGVCGYACFKAVQLFGGDFWSKMM